MRKGCGEAVGVTAGDRDRSERVEDQGEMKQEGARGEECHQ